MRCRWRRSTASRPLTDGASAIYGTDAIAGVINFVTRKGLPGLSIGADAGNSMASGGGEVYNASVAGGYGDLAKQGWNVFGAFSYRQQKSLKATDRDFAKSAVIPERGVFKASPTTFPANYTQGSTVASNPTLPNCDPPYSLFLPDVFGAGGLRLRLRAVHQTSCRSRSQLSLLARGSLALARTTRLHSNTCGARNTVDTVISPTPLTGLSMSRRARSTRATAPRRPIPALDTTQPISLGWRTTLAGGRASRFENETDRITASAEGTVIGWDYNAAIFQSELDGHEHVHWRLLEQYGHSLRAQRHRAAPRSSTRSARSRPPVQPTSRTT